MHAQTLHHTHVATTIVTHAWLCVCKRPATGWTRRTRPVRSVGSGYKHRQTSATLDTTFRGQHAATAVPRLPNELAHVSPSKLIAYYTNICTPTTPDAAHKADRNILFTDCVVWPGSTGLLQKPRLISF